MNTQAMKQLLSTNLPDLDQATAQQINQYVDALRQTNDRRGQHARPDHERELTVLEFQLAHFIDSRDERQVDLESEEIQATIRLKAGLFPLGIPYLVLCLDGRVLSKLFAGLHGHSVRLPAGDSKEIVPDTVDATPFLPDSSNFARTIYHTLEHLETNQTVVEVLDSHAHCAARKGEEEDRQVTQLPDYGRYQDVLRKKQMGHAIMQAVERRFGETRRVVIIQTGFNPETGYMKMGLERDEVLDDPNVQAHGFTHEVIEELVRTHKIISTQHLVQDPKSSEFRNVFSTHTFPVNYQTDYRTSTAAFWRAVDEMIRTSNLLETLEEKLRQLFVNAPNDEIRERAVLLLANAYNAYLHEQYPIYPYSEHDESVVVGTYSDLGPYDRIRAFSANPDDPNFCAHVVFAQKLIRANRAMPDDLSEPDRTYGRMSAIEADFIPKLYPDRRDFARAPVWQIKFERFRHIPDDIDRIRDTDWRDLATIPWRAMTDQQFGDYLEQKIPNISRNSALTINRLRHRAMRHYHPNQPTAPLLLEGQLVPLWILAGPDRRTLALLPFLKVGYSAEELTA